MSSEPAFIPLSVPHLAGNEWTYIKDCLDTGWVSSVGSYVTRFENDLAGAAGTRHAVATDCGTATLHVSAAGTRIPKPAALDYATPPQPRVSLDRARDAAARVAAAAGPYKRLNQKILKMKAAGK